MLLADAPPLPSPRPDPDPRATDDWGPGPGVAFACYFALALAFTWPLPLYARTHFWGVRYDMWGNLWLMWYFANGLRQHHIALTTPLLLYPLGFSLWAYGHFLLQLLAAPLLLVLPPTLLFALLVWLALATSAQGLYLLARELAANRWAAFIAGALYAYHGLKYAELAVGSLEQVATFGLPLYALFLLRWRRTGKWTWGAWAFLTLILTAMGNWFFGVALTLFTVVFTAFHLFVRREERICLDLGLLGRILALATVCFLAVSPILERVQPEILARPALGEEVPQLRNDEAFPGALADVTPDFVHRNALSQTVFDAVAVDRLLAEDMTMDPCSAGPGVLLISLALLGLWKGGRSARFWGVVSVLFLVVSMGPFLLLADDQTPSALLYPYYLLYNCVPWFRVAYRPYRYETLAIMALSVLAAFALAFVMRRMPRPKVAAVMALLILGSSMYVRCILCTPPRALLVDATVPAFYRDLASERAASHPGALIEIPYHHWAYTSSNSRFQYYQTVHQRPILNLSEFINLQQLLKLQVFRRDHPLIRVLDEGIRASLIEISPELREDARWLAAAGFSSIVVHTAFPVDEHHLVGIGESHDMVGEVLIDFLTALFGGPKEVEGALLFDVTGQGTGAPTSVSMSLHSLSSFSRVGLPIRLDPTGIRWAIDRHGWKRLAFWGSAGGEATSIVLRVTATNGGRELSADREIELSAKEWRRFTFSPDALGLPAGSMLVGVSILPGREGARVAIDQVQVVFDPPTGHASR